MTSASYEFLRRQRRRRLLLIGSEHIASRAGDPVRTQSGTPPYQAPDGDLTRRDVSTDLFAVGVMLYQLLCNGQHPYPNSRPIAGDPGIDP